jgi:tetratricopeptide (TPR) repeat protein
MKRSFYATLTAVVALFVMAGAANAQVPGTIFKKDGGKASGNIRYLPSSKMYQIQVGTVSVKVREAEISRLSIKKPVEISKAASYMAKKQYGSAIPLLKRVQTQYKHLQWDEYALRGLAECYFGNGMEAEGIKMVKKALEFGGESLSPSVVTKYWDALIKQKKYAELERSIERIVATGARSVAAVAQIKRGDMLREKGKLKEAAVDGYLRTVVFYEEEKAAREEAAYKAMKIFQDLGQQTYADKMRKILTSAYPNGKWTKKAQAGA